jgi:coenzyme F420-reducing hydrogenase gamma subunit
MTIANIHPFEIEVLACAILGLDYEAIDADTERIEGKIYDELGVDLEAFKEIVDRLVPLIDVGSSAMTGDTFKGFSNQNGEWFAKIKIS